MSSPASRRIPTTPYVCSFYEGKKLRPLLLQSPHRTPPPKARSSVMNSQLWSDTIKNQPSASGYGYFTTPQPLSHCLPFNKAQGHWLMLKYMGRTKAPVWPQLSHPSLSPGGAPSLISPSLKRQPCLPHPQKKSWLSSTSIPSISPTFECTGCQHPSSFAIADSSRDHFLQKEGSLDCPDLIPAPAKYT